MEKDQLSSRSTIRPDEVPGGMLHLFKDIINRLDHFTDVVPFDDFNRMCGFVAQSSDISVEEARNAVSNIMDELGLKPGPSSPEEEWAGQKATTPFGMQSPDFLAQPLSYKEVKLTKTASTFEEGDDVELMYEDTRDLLTKGHVLKINRDNTYDVMSFNGEVYQNVPLDRLHPPVAEGRSETQEKRMGEPYYGYFDSPRNLAMTDNLNDNPSEYADARGQEGKTVSDAPNPSLNE